MSYLVIILAVMFFLSKNNQAKGLLSQIDLDSILPMLSLFGIDEKVTNLISSNEIKNLLNGNGDIKSIMPIIFNILTSIKSKNDNYKPNENSVATYQNEYLNPIKDIANDEIISTLGNYFEH
jgi:hypothetical protein